jgi:hypothetical protein
MVKNNLPNQPSTPFALSLSKGFALNLSKGFALYLSKGRSWFGKALLSVVEDRSSRIRGDSRASLSIAASFVTKNLNI